MIAPVGLDFCHVCLEHLKQCHQNLSMLDQSRGVEDCQTGSEDPIDFALISNIPCPLLRCEPNDCF